ncbi:hypothetical protein SAMN00120144_3124 [Hymenobacter roseosalivarius DSM 11622]|uniref:Uncharacterized protein n=1 Tax=Hymenobacter roseosalivarius DSM 11622 TaxID=645990 RepID=A0A1W1UE77_9BACT|nr:hypothetical protein [Hymenobacter roseosalivarius]SMB79396.1 hypothetical protein SAMN00120144_3124 [Hymenobacter roseosalivarius DSM 11622]
MEDDELSFLEEQLAGTELLACVTCGEDTLHAHLEVLEVYPVGTELLMQCTRCQTERMWMDWTPPKPKAYHN